MNIKSYYTCFFEELLSLIRDDINPVEILATEGIFSWTWFFILVLFPFILLFSILVFIFIPIYYFNDKIKYKYCKKLTCNCTEFKFDVCSSCPVEDCPVFNEFKYNDTKE